jgi:DNA-binding SARP family transcriptional activator
MLYPRPQRRYNPVVEFRILGPLQVLDDGREVPLGSPKERALLAILLLHPGDVISRDRLIDELWGESPPPTAAKALRVHVSQLRKQLAQNGHTTPIATRTPGYAVHVDPEQVDAGRFERLVAEARDHAAAGDVSTAREVFRNALALWRGPVLEGIEFELSTRNELARLEDARLSAQMDRIDCDLALGSHEELIGELEALAAEHPLHERLRGQLMLALYRSGRQADALRVYREASETLVRELGLQPSPSLQRLERAILNHDPALEAPAGIGGAAATAPDTIPTVRRRRPSRSSPFSSRVHTAEARSLQAQSVSSIRSRTTSPPRSMYRMSPHRSPSATASSGSRTLTKATSASSIRARGRSSAPSAWTSSRRTSPSQRARPG